MLSNMTRLEAVSDPVRLRLVRHLERTGEASLHDLADAAEVHLNTVRPHVAALEEEGVLERASVPPSGRGRPQLRYRLAPGWTLPSSDFRGLAEVLAAALARGGASAADVRAVGLEWGRYLLGRPGARNVERDLPLALERLGFDAAVDGRVLRLSGCPCPLVLPDGPELICELVIAVADGVLAGAGSPLHAGRREHDPERRACCVELVGGAAA
jgi:predicted ArsR family transcriptional regulator